MPLKNLWYYLSDLGTQHLSSFEAKRIRIVNRLCLALGIICLIFIIPWGLEANSFMIKGNLILLAFYALAIFCNYKHFHNWASGLLIFSTSTGVFVISGMKGINSPLYYGLTSFSAFSIILFNRKEKVKILIGILYPLLLLTLLIYKDFEIFPNLIGPRLAILNTFDYIANFCLIMTTILCFYSYYISAEDKFRILFEEHLEAQSQLHEEKAKALVSSKMAALGEMAGGIAHEINNPLFVIKATIQGMIKDIPQQKLTSEEILEKCKMIEKTCSRINNIIRSLKTISGSSENTPMDSHNAKNLIEDTLVICQHRFHISSLPINVIYETDQTTFQVRPVEFVQVLVNLLNNAYDALQGIQNPYVNIRVKNENNYLVINVEDNGSGIPIDKQNKVFEAFYTTKSPDKGTGLGLSLSKKLIENNNGKILLASSPGNTIFTLKFPL